MPTDFSSVAAGKQGQRAVGDDRTGTRAAARCAAAPRTGKAWTITIGVPVLSAHVVVDEDCVADGRRGEVFDQLGTCPTGHFDVAHFTSSWSPSGTATTRRPTTADRLEVRPLAGS